MGASRASLWARQEPTNHLDLETIDGLVDALNKFEGGILIVTHNVSLISKVCKEIWECGADKSVTPFPGDFEDYAARLVKELKDAEVRRRVLGLFALPADRSDLHRGLLTDSVRRGPHRFCKVPLSHDPVRLPCTARGNSPTFFIGRQASAG